MPAESVERFVMKKLLATLLVLVGMGISGCGSCCCSCPTVTETGPERCQRICDIDTLQMKMAVEDCDYFWLQDRSSGLTPWHVQIGLHQ